MASGGGRHHRQHVCSSSPLSTPGGWSEERVTGNNTFAMDDMVDPRRMGATYDGMRPQLAQSPTNIPLTAAGLPRKKPGRKPGSTIKPKNPADDSIVDASKPKRIRKSKDANAPPVQRKRKAAAVDEPDAMETDGPSLSATAGDSARQHRITELTSMRMSMDTPRASTTPAEPSYSPLSLPPRRDGPASMQSILNSDPPAQSQPAPPTTGRQMFDPVRGNYDPVRETMIARDPYGISLGSPRPPGIQAHSRTCEATSIASLVDPQPQLSPVPSHGSHNNATTTQSRFQEPVSLPTTPTQHTHTARSAPSHPSTCSATEAKRTLVPSNAPAAAKQEAPNVASFTATSKATVSCTPVPAPAVATQSKKVTAVKAVAKEERDSQHKKASSSSSSPRVSAQKNTTLDVPDVSSGRSILDFGKARPGEEPNAPSIVLHVPLNGETNKYVNFMRVAEEIYGWDALHPRQAANRERKARIAAATAALEKNGSGRESGDDMDEDLQSDGENSIIEMGGARDGAGGTASGPEGAPAKPVRKKRVFKEDDYDRDDDFVDDSDMLWEEQAAASKDGFFVYSGPLIPEVEQPKVPAGLPKRGRGSRGGVRGGARGGAARAEGPARGRGGGPGSRGGSVTRKPRITKLEKEQRDKEKADREKMAQMASKAAAYNVMQLGGGFQNSGSGATG